MTDFDHAMLLHTIYIHKYTSVCSSLSSKQLPICKSLASCHNIYVRMSNTAEDMVVIQERTLACTVNICHPASFIGPKVHTCNTEGSKLNKVLSQTYARRGEKEC